MQWENKIASMGALLMFSLSAAWILLSDYGLKWLVSEPDYPMAQSLKGIFYVGLASALVYFLLYRHERQHRLLLKHRVRLAEAEAMRASSMLVFSIAHDIRNLVAAYSINLNFLRIHTPAESAETHEVLGELAELTKRLNGLTDRLSADRGSETRSFLVGKVITEFVELLNRSRLLKNRVRVKVEGKPAGLHGNVGLLEQMLANLILNADQATENGQPVEVSLSVQEATVEIKVADQGSGIAQDMVDKIWEPLFTTKENGTGLGMLVVKEAVDSFDGVVSLHSIPGEGTSFTVQLPLPQESTAQQTESDGNYSRTLLRT